MRSDIADLKQKLELKEVNKYCWMQDERMLADVLTKEKKEKLGLDDLMKENKLDIVKNEDNCVKYTDGEFEITGRKLQDKLVPIPKITKRKKLLEKEKRE